VPNFNINQAQKIGFMGLVKPYEFILAFICVVILPSIVEELIFRGIMYGELRKISVLWAVILVSVLFGAAHGQLNVAITTFAMSLVMCFTREKLTDSIWAGMVLHFIKNAIGFVIIFTMPGLWL
jgi:membrane protease YdiL (CAAX protease family)